jgi:hypothetical protein
MTPFGANIKDLHKGASSATLERWDDLDESDVYRKDLRISRRDYSNSPCQNIIGDSRVSNLDIC